MSKLTPWNKLVRKTYNDGKRKTASYSLGDAMKDASASLNRTGKHPGKRTGKRTAKGGGNCKMTGGENCEAIEDPAGKKACEERNAAAAKPATPAAAAADAATANPATAEQKTEAADANPANPANPAATETKVADGAEKKEAPTTGGRKRSKRANKRRGGQSNKSYNKKRLTRSRSKQSTYGW